MGICRGETAIAAAVAREVVVWMGRLGDNSGVTEGDNTRLDQLRMHAQGGGDEAAAIQGPRLLARGVM